MVEISVTKKYGERTVLDVSGLRFERGRIYAVMGSNGSGKSTLAAILAGVIKGNGEIIYDVKKPVTGYMPQKSFAFDMSLTANMLLGRSLRERKEAKNKAMRLLEEFGLGELDLLGCFDGADLAPLAARARALEEQLLALLRSHGADPCAYGTLDDFLAARQ